MAKYGEGPFLAADAVVKSADDCILLNRRGEAPQKGRACASWRQAR